MISILSKKDHWSITKDEAESIAAPLETMLAQIPAKTKQQLEKITAPAILGAAIAGVVMPRIIIDIEQGKRVKTIHVETTTAGAQQEIKRDRSGDAYNAPQVDRGQQSPAAPQANIPSVSAKIAGLFSDGNLGTTGG